MLAQTYVVYSSETVSKQFFHSWAVAAALYGWSYRTDGSCLYIEIQCAQREAHMWSVINWQCWFKLGLSGNPTPTVYNRMKWNTTALQYIPSCGLVSFYWHCVREELVQLVISGCRQCWIGLYCNKLCLPWLHMYMIGIQYVHKNAFTHITANKNAKLITNKHITSRISNFS